MSQAPHESSPTGETSFHTTPAARGGDWRRGVAALIALWLFISAVNMIGGGLKTMAGDPVGKERIEGLFAMVSDPATGLFVGLLTTALVQSSSFTTTMTVGFVASGAISLTAAIPVIMGANIGTSVTNLLVSLGHIRRRREFRRSLAGAIVHDFFNVLSVALVYPLERMFGVISRPIGWLSGVLGQTELFAPDAAHRIGGLKRFFGLLAGGVKWFLTDLLDLPPLWAGGVLTVLALVALFGALAWLVRLLRGMMQDRLSGVFDRTIFRNAGLAFLMGIVLTAAVQSSSVTTSLVVPLVGAGILKLRQIYPYTLGANIGTTLTAILAALGTGSAPALACGLGHMLFNLYGTAVFWPLQFIPISLAKGFARIAARRRYVAVLFLGGVFFVLPLVIIAATRLLKTII
jgi:sodium-dependent phosphate cotransporter